MKYSSLLAAPLVALVFSGTAFADPWAPHGTLVFTEPTAVVGASDTIVAQMTLTLDSTSQAIDMTQPYAFDLPDGWTSVTSYHVNVGFGCNDTFSGGCSGVGKPYAFGFDYTSDGIGKIQDGTLVLNPGQSITFNAFIMTPNPAPVPAGTYSAYYYDISGYVQGTKIGQLSDADGNPLFDDAGAPVMGEVIADQNIDIASTCWKASDCASNQSFTRTVVGVPEPETYAMIVAGLGVMGGVAVRRRKARSL